MYTDYIPVIVFAALAVGLLIAPLVIQHLVSPRHDKSESKQMSYECGEVPEGSAWVKFNIRFYIIALVFIIFDVEVVFLFPWAVVYQDFIASGNGLLVLIEMLLFVTILTIGFAYVWVKGDLDWVKMKLKYAYGRYSDLGMDKK
tara:strand:- start:167 stop:598 length:432 start_codon:yes stop_codon:yes gene_type:complete